MKKVISILVLIAIVFTSAAFSSSNYFEGLPVVNFLIDGKTVASDVPAVILNGRTMVPVRVISENLGANVNWNNNTYTVEISKPQTDADQTNDILLLKEYGEIANVFNTLDNMYTTFNLVNDAYWLVIDYSNASNEVELLDRLVTNHEYTGERYNIALERVNTLKETLIFSSNEVAIASMYDILDDYYTALEEHDKAILNLIEYLKYGFESKYQESITNLEDASDSINAASKKAYNLYFDYIYNVIDY